MTFCQSFAPVVSAHSRVLVLGSMPGTASLQQQQYYAHPRNAFWPVMQALLGIDPAWLYARRIAALSDSPVALWDVIGRCHRHGSLDTAIDADSVVANDFDGLLQRYPAIRTIVFNGQSVATLFRRHVPPLHMMARMPDLLCLPSTSPANARLSLAEKQRQWCEALLPLLADERNG